MHTLGSTAMLHGSSACAVEPVHQVPKLSDTHDGGFTAMPCCSTANEVANKASKCLHASVAG